MAGDKKRSASKSGSSSSKPQTAASQLTEQQLAELEEQKRFLEMPIEQIYVRVKHRRSTIFVECTNKDTVRQLKQKLLYLVNPKSQPPPFSCVRHPSMGINGEQFYPNDVSAVRLYMPTKKQQLLVTIAPPPVSSAPGTAAISLIKDESAAAVPVSYTNFSRTGAPKGSKLMESSQMDNDSTLHKLNVFNGMVLFATFNVQTSGKGSWFFLKHIHD